MVLKAFEESFHSVLTSDNLCYVAKQPAFAAYHSGTKSGTKPTGKCCPGAVFGAFIYTFCLHISHTSELFQVPQDLANYPQSPHFSIAVLLELMTL